MDLSEFVNLPVRFLSGHTVPVGMKHIGKRHLLAAGVSGCLLSR